MTVIGLGHYSRTGKDTFADYSLQYIHRLDPTVRAKKLPFAWKLKDIARQLYGWAGLREAEFYDTPEGAPLRDEKLPVLNMTPVEVWVALGTPAVRDCVYDKTWINFVFESDHDADVLFVPDVRFHNEIDASREYGATLIKVVRPGYGPRKTVADRAILNYRGWDYVIGSSGELAELESWAEMLAKKVCFGEVMREQSQEDKEAALSVEVIEPWAPPSQANKAVGLQLDAKQAEELFAVYALMGLSLTLPDFMRPLLEEIERSFPEVSRKYPVLS